MATPPTLPQLPSLTPAQVLGSEPEQWRLWIKQALADTRCASPAFLAEDMNVDTQLVTVQVAVQERVRTRLGNQWWDIPPIFNVPILVPRGGGFSVTLPLKQGDQGLLIFCDTCFDNWWQNGQANAPTAQNWQQLNRSGPIPSGSQTQFELRRHHVHDCGFFPGMWSKNNVLANYSDDSMQIRSDDGTTIIDIAEGGVTITGTAVTVSGSDTVTINSPSTAVANGGTALPLVNDTFYQWFVATYMPSVEYTGVMPTPPSGPTTTILKGQ